MNDARSLRRCLLRCSSRQAVSNFLRSADGDDLGFLEADWATLARDDQWSAPATKDEVGPAIWLFIGGRGAGKTRAGAEWVRRMAIDRRLRSAGEDLVRIALVGPTLNEVRQVMVEGPSGLLAVHGARDVRPVFEPSRRQLTWPGLAIAQIFSAEEPDSLRGFQFHAAWCDGRGPSPPTLILHPNSCCSAASPWATWTPSIRSTGSAQIVPKWKNSAHSSTLEGWHHSCRVHLPDPILRPFCGMYELNRTLAHIALVLALSFGLAAEGRAMTPSLSAYAVQEPIRGEAASGGETVSPQDLIYVQSNQSGKKKAGSDKLMIPPSAALQAALRYAPGSKGLGVRLLQGPRLMYAVKLKTGDRIRRVLIDARTGQVLGE